MIESKPVDKSIKKLSKTKIIKKKLEETGVKAKSVGKVKSIGKVRIYINYQGSTIEEG